MFEKTTRVRKATDLALGTLPACLPTYPCRAYDPMSLDDLVDPLGGTLICSNVGILKAG